MPLKDHNRKMALACAAVSAVGLLVMLLSDRIAEAPRIEIGSVSDSMAGERVILCGAVQSKYDNGKDTVFLNLSDGRDSISAVFFRDVKERTSGIGKKSGVCIEGNIQIYKGRPELVGRKVINDTKQ